MIEDTTTRKIIWIVSIIFALSMLTIVSYVFYLNGHSIGKSEPLSYNDMLMLNPDFRAGEEYAKQGKFAEAAEAYKRSYSNNLSIPEKGHIVYKIGGSLESVNIEESIKLLKSVADDDLQSNAQRGYAVLRMAMAHYRNGDKDVTSLIFNTIPYSDFFKEGDEDLAYRRLFEYSSKLYPIAAAELRSADWYAGRLFTLKKKTSRTEDEEKQVEEYRKIIQEKITNAGTAFKKEKDDPFAVGLAPDTLARRASLLSTLYYAKEVSSETVEAAFEQALASGAASGQDATARFGYAVFIARSQGEKGKSKVVLLMKPVYTNFNGYKGLKNLFISEKNNRIGAKSGIVAIAKVDPDFKKALLTLGWVDSDFK